MPELPDIEAYLGALHPRIAGRAVEGVRVSSPFFVRSADPPLEAVEGQRVHELRRIGKRIVIGLSEDLFLVLHLMIAGRLRWARRGSRGGAGRITLASFDFPAGTLVVTEAGSKKRASLHVVRGERALAGHDPGGLEVLDADEDSFQDALLRENHTVKRALTDPRLFSGIGNAYSDEILHAARLSPLAWTSRLSPDQIKRFYGATRQTLARWTAELRERFAERFPGPGDITAFREGFAVHGRYGQPCPDCGQAVQRIRYADNETNYCPPCQTGGRVLADRSLSRLFKDDWPRTIEALETAHLSPEAQNGAPGQRRGPRRHESPNRRCSR